MESINKTLQAGPVALDQLVQYAPDSVVSRTLIKKDEGTVTFFAFDQGQGLSTHSAPFDALVCVIDGEARITVGEKEHLVRASEALLLPAEVPHGLEAVRPFKMMLVMVKEAASPKSRPPK